MGTKAWGKHLWYSLHFIALGYPSRPTPNDSQRYKDFYSTLHFFIPCKRCAQNYIENLKEIAIDKYLTDAKSLFEWTVKLHNKVNSELGKKQWTVEQAYSFYTDLLEKDTSEPIKPSRSPTTVENPSPSLIDAHALLYLVFFTCIITFIFVAFNVYKKQL